MAINPNISLGVKPVEIENPAVWQARALQVRNAQQDAAMNDIQLEEHRQKLAANQRREQATAKLSELLAQHSQAGQDGKLNINHTGVYRGLADSGYGDLAIEYDKARRADMKATADQAKQELENVKTKSQLVGQLLGAVRQAPDDQKAQAYQIARQWGVQQGLISEQDAPPQYDPQFVETAFMGAIEADKQVDNARANLDFDLRLADFNHKVLTERPKTATEWVKIGAQIAGAARTPEQWDAGLKSMQEMGAPKEALDILGDPFDAERANTLGMTPEQRASQEAQQAQRAETERHNLATEAAAVAGQDLTRRGQDITIRGQNMTDARARETNDLTRGKLESGAVKDISDLRNGLGQIDRLAAIIEQNSAIMGPVVGRMANEAGQAVGYTRGSIVRAEIDQTRQLIGKALEGGVLRKEDEEKYKAILPTMTDQPEVARAKVKMLRERLTRDLNTFIETQAASGRRVPDVGVTPGASKTVRMVAPNGQMKDVPESEVEFYIQRGAKRAR